MISIIVPCSHMARIDSEAELHIKEDFIITIITVEDAITDIIALVLILFCTLTKAAQRKEKREELVLFFEQCYTSLTACPQVALILNLH